MSLDALKRNNRFTEADTLKKLKEKYDSLRQLLYALAIALLLSLVLMILDYNGII